MYENEQELRESLITEERAIAQHHL
jgi:hypothetical protein